MEEKESNLENISSLEKLDNSIDGTLNLVKSVLEDANKYATLKMDFRNHEIVARIMHAHSQALKELIESRALFKKGKGNFLKEHDHEKDTLHRPAGHAHDGHDDHNGMESKCY